MSDGSQRCTLHRDTVSDTHPFPDYLAEESAKITSAFDRVDEFFTQILKEKFGPKLDVLNPNEDNVTTWDDYDTLTHLHMYSRGQQQNNASFMLPYHTGIDNLEE